MRSRIEREAEFSVEFVLGMCVGYLCHTLTARPESLSVNLTERSRCQIGPETLIVNPKPESAEG